MLVTVMEAEHNDDPTHYDMIFLHVFYDLGGGTKKGGGHFFLGYRLDRAALTAQAAEHFGPSQWRIIKQFPVLIFAGPIVPPLILCFCPNRLLPPNPGNILLPAPSR